MPTSIGRDETRRLIAEEDAHVVIREPAYRAVRLRSLSHRTDLLMLSPSRIGLKPCVRDGLGRLLLFGTQKVAVRVLRHRDRRVA